MIDFISSYSCLIIIILIINLYFGIYVLAPRIENLNLNSTTEKYTHIVFFLSIISFIWGIILLFQLVPEWGQYNTDSVIRSARGNIMLIVIPFAVIVGSGFLIRMCFYALKYFKSKPSKKLKKRKKITG